MGEFVLGDNYLQIVPPDKLILTGFSGLDQLLGSFGVPRGRFTEISGSSQSGKTVFLLLLAARVQQQGGVVAWVNADNTFSPDLARLCGVNVPPLVMISHCPAEDTFSICAALAGTVDFLVIDPISALGSAKEMNAPGFPGDTSASHFRAVSNGLRTLFSAMVLSSTAVCLASQLRWNPQKGTVSASVEEDLNYYSTRRFRLSVLNREADGGSYHEVKLTRDASNPERIGSTAHFFFDPQVGPDCRDSIIDAACASGLLLPVPGGFFLSGWGIMCNKSEWTRRLRREPILRKDLEKRLEAGALDL